MENILKLNVTHARGKYLACNFLGISRTISADIEKMVYALHGGNTS
jgi:hypothetical protein